MKSKITLFSLIINVLVAFFIFYSSDAFCSMNDFVYVVALEKPSVGKPSIMWHPTLYKIDIEKGVIVKHIKLADQGAPILCEPVGDNGIHVTIEEGIAANGTSVGRRVTREIIVDKSTMAIIDSKTIQGIDESKVPIEELMKKTKRMDIPNLPKGEQFLVASSVRRRVFVLTDYKNKQNLSVKVLDSNSFQAIDLIPLGVGDRNLGKFFGYVNTKLVGDRFLICLFDGAAYFGHFAPGYVMIVHTVDKSVKYVAIGSDPALGICY